MEHSQDPVVGRVTFGQQFSYAQEGWECPKCKRVYSPSSSLCFYCHPPKMESATDKLKTLLNEGRN